MEIKPTELPGVLLIEPRVFADPRGFFMETYHKARFNEHGLNGEFVQDNHSRSVRGALRGLHYQIEHPQGKLVRVVVGAVFDVAVDLRQASPTYGRWVGVELSAANRRQLYVPPGCAHGFYVQSDEAEIIYKCTDFYYPQHERTLLWKDAQVGIAWPLVGEPILSTKDEQGESFATCLKYD